MGAVQIEKTTRRPSEAGCCCLSLKQLPRDRWNPIIQGEEKPAIIVISIPPDTTSPFYLRRWSTPAAQKMPKVMTVATFQ